MKKITIVVSRLRVIVVCILLGSVILASLLMPKNEESEKMIVEYSDNGVCEILLWNDDKLVARLYSEDYEDCKFYLIKNSSD